MCVNAPDDGLCDDGNDCTDGVCAAGTGCTFSPDDTNACTDLDVCTTDACDNGQCRSTPVECPDDGDFCTRLTCDTAGAEGNCDLVVPDNEGLTCTDENLCTREDVCTDGVCAGADVDCSAFDDACNAGECDPLTGDCRQVPANEGGPCDDLSPCTEDDACENGLCVGLDIPDCRVCIVPIDCDDFNPCTDDLCPAGVCVYQDNVEPCDDLDECTEVDVCLDGECAGTLIDCTFLDTDCAEGACVAGACEALAVNEGGDCEDGLFCTIGETCFEGQCGGGVENLCDDFIDCTVDSCDEDNDVCVNAPDDGLCDDENDCTDDVCAEGVGCEFTANDDNVCSDGDPCTDDVCQDGACVSTVVQCPDSGDVCTRLECDPSGPDGNCNLEVSDNEGGDCDDGSLCSVDDMCTDGVCVGVDVDCTHLDDTCNEGVCNQGTGTCLRSPINEGGDCDDGNLCTEDDACAAGTCRGIAVDCSHLDDDCNDGFCNPGTGACLRSPINNGGVCSDDDLCTTGDLCDDGDCRGVAVDCSHLDDDCNEGVCNPANGNCVASAINDGLACEDGLFCTLNETCLVGLCGGGSDHPCDDGIDCTLDACDETDDRCVHTPDHAACDDDNACTDDACAEGVGCESTANDENACTDGDTCTVDACRDGVCVGTDVDCPDDGDPCTRLVCDPSGFDGNCDLVLADNEGGECDDGLFCTLNEFCTDGVCGGGQDNPCDDDVNCTADTCDEDADDCVHATDDAICDDHEFCTGEESCDDVKGCLPGTPPCDDPAEPFCDEGADACVDCLAPSDATGDGLVDLADFAEFADCMTGPVGPVEPPAYLVSCQCLDSDNDGDVDLVDYGALQVRFVDF